MPLIVTHVLVGIILIELYRNFFVKDNRKFPRYYILMMAIACIIPDLDYLAFYILYFFGFTIEQVHRTFLHTFFLPAIFFIIGGLIYFLKLKYSYFGKKHIHLSTIFFIFGFGCLIHLLLDMTFSGQIMPFYPLSKYAVGLNLIQYVPSGLQGLIAPTIDAVLLFFWICWLEFKLKVTRYF